MHPLNPIDLKFIRQEASYFLFPRLSLCRNLIHGIFTRHLRLALAGKADHDGDGFITASEIGTYIRPTVSRQTINAQTPKFGWLAGEGDFIFKNTAISN